MKKNCLLLSILLLLAAWPVGAEESSIYADGVPCVLASVDMRGKVVAKCNGLHIDIFPDPCLARLEEAMNAVEPWIGYTYKDDTYPEKFKQAKALFYRVKTECWKNPHR